MRENTRYFYDNNLNELALKLLKFSKEKASEEGVLSRRILRKKAIIGICAEKPNSIEKLLALPIPLSKKQIQKYGQEIIRMVRNAGENQNAMDMADSGVAADNISDEILNDEKCIAPDGVITIKQGGYYYNVYGNDALILHNHLGYKLYGKNILRTGFPVAGEKTVLSKLDALSINYDLIDKTGNLVVSRRFENNLYEIYPAYKASVFNEDQLIKDQPAKMNFKDRINYYFEILNGLSEEVNVITGEMVEGLDSEIKLQFLEMSKYFDQKLKSKEKKENKYPNQGQKWSEEEDEQLLSEYRESENIREISKIHNRSYRAIHSRLLKLGVLEQNEQGEE